MSRRAGATGQIEAQGRSHGAADCGTYRLIARRGRNEWVVEWIAPCDAPGTMSTLRFVSPAQYARHF